MEMWASLSFFPPIRSQVSTLNLAALCAVSCPCPGDSSPVERVCVLGLLHEELHGPGPMGALSSLAQTEVTLSGTASQTSAHILYRRPRQRPTHKVRSSTGGLGVQVRREEQ